MVLVQVGPLVIRDDDKLSPELQSAIENEVKCLIKVKLILIYFIVVQFSAHEDHVHQRISLESHFFICLCVNLVGGGLKSRWYEV